MIVPIGPPDTGLADLPIGGCMLLSDEKNTPSDNSADMVMTPSSRTDGDVISAVREAYPLPQGVTELHEPHVGSKNSGRPDQLMTSSPADMPLLNARTPPETINPST